ncbi:uncharacterized protein G2W53_035352 [Senna tora]|uniref:Uncharacterized protein n=1 Tax=Senna tora TaxID=362788 RepID=A0A834W967_9FABA|nr:uncharacterized protein G2W53_035352 [Senna tora]
MASGVIANDTLHMNMTLMNLISKLQEAEVEKIKPKGDEMVEFEMLAKMKVEEELKEQQKKGKEVEERYKNSLEDGKKREEQPEITIRKLRMENRKLIEELTNSPQLIYDSPS